MFGMFLLLICFAHASSSQSTFFGFLSVFKYCQNCFEGSCPASALLGTYPLFPKDKSHQCFPTPEPLTSASTVFFPWSSFEVSQPVGFNFTLRSWTQQYKPGTCDGYNIVTIHGVSGTGYYFGEGSSCYVFNVTRG